MCGRPFFVARGIRDMQRPRPIQGAAAGFIRV
jgi:hypothetical protein